MYDQQQMIYQKRNPQSASTKESGTKSDKLTQEKTSLSTYQTPALKYTTTM